MHIEGDMIIFQGVPVAEIVEAWPTITEKFIRLIELAEDAEDVLRVNESSDVEIAHLNAEIDRLENIIKAISPELDV